MTDPDSPVVPRPRPCASCPYRRGVASGIWSADEYAKLALYDEDTHAQPVAVFLCHQGGREQRHACSGWLGHADPTRLLAVRIGLISGQVDESCMDYTTDVELFDSGAEAAAHGSRDILHPKQQAMDTIAKIVRTRHAVGDAVTFD